MKNILKQAIYFYNVTNEEQLMQNLLDEGEKCVKREKYEDAEYLFE